MRQVDLADLGAHRLEALRRRRAPLADLGRDALHVEHVAHDADPQARHVGVARGGRRSPRQARSTLVASIGSLPQIASSTSALSSTVARERPDLVERADANATHAVAADATVRRLERDRAGERSRLADRAAGVAAERDGRHARPRPPPRCPRSSRRARGRGPTGCCVGPNARVLAGAAERELVHVALAERQHARVEQAARRRCSRRRSRSSRGCGSSTSCACR